MNVLFTNAREIAWIDIQKSSPIEFRNIKRLMLAYRLTQF